MPRYRTPPTSIGFGKPSRRDATKRMRNRGMTYADFCCFATTLEALTWAVARTVVWAATANILTCKVCVCFKDGGCGNAGSRAAGRLLLWTLSVRKWMEKIFERSFLARLLAKTRGGYLKAELVILKLVFLCNPKIIPLLNLNFYLSGLPINPVRIDPATIFWPRRAWAPFFSPIESSWHTRRRSRPSRWRSGRYRVSFSRVLRPSAARVVLRRRPGRMYPFLWFRRSRPRLRR